MINLYEVIGEARQVGSRWCSGEKVRIFCDALFDSPQHGRDCGDPLLLSRWTAGYQGVDVLHGLIQGHLSTLQTLSVILHAKQGALRHVREGNEY